MNWLHYLVEANLYLSVFYLCYCLFLNKETHYTLNRVYLLFICVISFVLPLLQIGILKPVEAIAQKQVVVLSANMVYSASPTQIAVVQPTHFVEATHFTLQDGILCTYLLGVGILMILLAIKLYKLIMLRWTNSIINDNGYKLIYIEESNTAFSFFNYLFLGTKAPGKGTIIKHELVHINQKHSVDILFLEFFKIINWFNPLIYLLQNSLKTVHEYIADEQTAINEGDPISYSSFLVDNAYGISGSSITHSFFNYNLLKKRIIMLNQQRSGNLARLKYLIAVPLCAALLCVSTLGFSKTYGWIDLAPAHNLTDTKPVTGNDTIKSENRSVTSKGYHYREEGYLVNNKADYRVVISLKNGEEVSYFKNSATRTEIKLLKEKYGYTFPSMPIYNRLLPPPPMPAAGKPTPPKPKVDAVKFPPPIVVRNGYLKLYNHLRKTIHYSPQQLKEDQIASVIVGFTITDNHKLSDIKIIKSGDNAFDKATLKGFQTYNGIVGGTPGNHSFVVHFDSDGKFEKIDPAVYNQKGYSGDIEIIGRDAPPIVVPDIAPIPPKPKVDQVKFPPPVVKPGKPMPPKPKVDRVKFPPPGVKPGKPMPPKPTVDQVKFPPPVEKPDKPMPPKPKVDQVKFPPPIVVTDSERHSLEKFYGSLQKSIHYPAVDRENKMTGRVFVSFTVNADHKIDLVKVLRGPSSTLEDEVASALKRVGSAPGTKPGIAYVVPVSFNLTNADGSYVADKPYVAAPRKTVANTLKMPNIHIELSEIVIIGYLSQ